jgi:hypothetical protein
VNAAVPALPGVLTWGRKRRGAFRLREFVDQRLVHDPGADGKGTVDEFCPGVGQSDDDRAGAILGLAASQLCTRL